MNNLVISLGRLLKEFEEKKRLTAAGNEEKKEKEAFYQVIKEARKDWENAHSFFNNVSDPDLVDHAIHAMEAAEKKYQYLIKQARLDLDAEKRDKIL